MKKNLLTIITLCLFITVSAQKNEVSFALGSGLFSFSGQSAGQYSQINYDNFTNYGYTNNPYGSKNGLCYGFSVNLKRVTKKNLLFGIDLGYEGLKSKVGINGINGFTRTAAYEYTATGKTFLNYNFINMYPYIGHRFLSKKMSFDVIGGFDIAYCLKATEQGSATATNGTKYITSVDRKTIKTDLRPRVQVSVNYRTVGFYLGYSYGLVNYKSHFAGGINECSARLIRFGVTYQLK